LGSFGHLIATKVLSRDDRRRPRDKQDLVNLLRIADEADLQQARCALATIQDRGFGRGRALVEEMVEALREFRIAPP
jgi:hypothetical protein